MMRTLAKEEKIAIKKKRELLDWIIEDAKKNGSSKSQLKKLKAHIHNVWQEYLKENKIISLLGYTYTELETPIEGSVNEIN